MYSTQTVTLLPLLLLSLSPIQIDGSFSDWPEGIVTQTDSNYVYALVTVPKEACLQQLPKELSLQLGAYTITFSPEDKGYGISCTKGSVLVSPYEAGVVFAPTTASTTFEIRVNKDDQQSLEAPFDLTPKGDLRVLSWNVQFGNLLEDRDRGKRILKSLQPDVLLLQELDGEDTPEMVAAFLEETLGGVWNVSLTKVSGTERQHQLRSGIASTNKLRTPEQIGSGSWKQLKAIFASVPIKNNTIDFISLHLRCCGGPTSEAEEQRQEEANAIRSFLNSRPASSLIIAGDWNLVGTAKPLDIVRSGHLAVVNAFQPDGRLTATWSDTSSSFTAGRLDWMVYSPNTLNVVNCFVLDTGDLDSKTRSSYNLNPEDTAELSDHLPLVADFAFIAQ